MAESIQCYQCGTRMTLEELVKNQDDCPECGAQHSINDVAKALELNTRAQLPIQGGEAVEVVAWRHWGDKTRLLCDLGKQRAIPGTIADEFTVPLMEVAQHKRILAASVGSAEPVGVVLTEEQMGIGYDRRIGPVLWFGGYPKGGTKLYAHPADQVAEGLVVSQSCWNNCCATCQRRTSARVQSVPCWPIAKW
jgi:hypothetical protein